MRLAAITLSATLLSACSWNGDTYGQYEGYGQSGYYDAYGVPCVPQTANYGNNVYGYQGQPGCMPAGQMGYAGAQPLRGSYGVGQYGTVASPYGAPSAMGATTLSAAAPYGAALNGGAVMASNNVTTVQGEPVYVAEPYAQPYYQPYVAASTGCAPTSCAPTSCVSAPSGCSTKYVGGAMPWGLELFAGTAFDVDGDVFHGKEASANNTNLALATAEVVAPKVEYNDAFDTPITVGGALGYDFGPNTTLLGQVSYTQADGEDFEFGTFQPGTYDALGNFTATGPQETIQASMGDLKQWTVEAGFRQYFGDYTSSIRPYIGATAGATHSKSVDIVQNSPTLGTVTQEYIDSGWSPTASGIVGAEVALSNRMAVGIESGIRWTDDLDTNISSDDRITIPLQIRGRVAF